MNVRLAAQVLSESVANALIFCKSIDTSFTGAVATAEFCTFFNNAFDILNSRNKFSKQLYNKPISSSTLDTYSAFIEDFCHYVNNLRDVNGRKLIHCVRNRGFLGFITALRNTVELYKHLNNTYNLEYLLTYKLCQDHLENLFSSIRSCGGFNNNPSCTQFQTVYKKLIVHHGIAALDYGNCSILDATFILPIGNTTVNNIIEAEDSKEEQEVILHSFCNPDTLSLYVSDIVQYIAGFVVRKLKKKLVCATCIQYLEKNDTTNILITIKNRGH